MSERREPRFDQESIDHEARNHLEAVLVPLRRIGGGSTEQGSVGYVEVDEHRRERFTLMGQSMVASTRQIAWNGATYLGEDVLPHTLGSQDTGLLDDVQRWGCRSYFIAGGKLSQIAFTT